MKEQTHEGTSKSFLWKERAECTVLSCMKAHAHTNIEHREHFPELHESACAHNDKTRHTGDTRKQTVRIWAAFKCRHTKIQLRIFLRISSDRTSGRRNGHMQKPPRPSDSCSKSYQCCPTSQMFPPSCCHPSASSAEHSVRFLFTASPNGTRRARDICVDMKVRHTVSHVLGMLWTRDIKHLTFESDAGQVQNFSRLGSKLVHTCKKSNVPRKKDTCKKSNVLHKKDTCEKSNVLHKSEAENLPMLANDVRQVSVLHWSTDVRHRYLARTGVKHQALASNPERRWHVEMLTFRRTVGHNLDTRQSGVSVTDIKNFRVWMLDWCQIWNKQTCMEVRDGTSYISDWPRCKTRHEISHEGSRSDLISDEWRMENDL